MVSPCVFSECSSPEGRLTEKEGEVQRGLTVLLAFSTPSPRALWIILPIVHLPSIALHCCMLHPSTKPGLGNVVFAERQHVSRSQILGFQYT